MGKGQAIGSILGGIGGFALGGPGGAMAGAAAGGSIGGAFDKDKEAAGYNRKALEQAEYEFNLRAPLRRQGMQALGQIEAPIDMGNIGFNASNPFAAARGPAQSTAKLGNWDRMTTAPEQIDNAILGVTDDDLAWAQDATTRRRPDGSFAYKASERNHAQQQILNKANQRAGFSGIQPLLDTRMGAMRDRNAATGGFTAGGAAPASRNAQRRGMQPLGGMAR